MLLSCQSGFPSGAEPEWANGELIAPPSITPSNGARSLPRPHPLISCSFRFISPCAHARPTDPSLLLVNNCPVTLDHCCSQLLFLIWERRDEAALDTFSPMDGFAFTQTNTAPPLLTPASVSSPLRLVCLPASAWLARPRNESAALRRSCLDFIYLSALRGGWGLGGGRGSVVVGAEGWAEADVMLPEPDAKQQTFPPSEEPLRSLAACQLCSSSASSECVCVCGCEMNICCVYPRLRLRLKHSIRH